MPEELIYIYLGIITFFLNFVIAIIASDKGRNGVLWFVFSVFITPYVAMFLMLLIGETKEKRREKFFEQEEFKIEYANNNMKQDLKKENVIKQINPSGKTINDLYSNNK